MTPDKQTREALVERLNETAYLLVQAGLPKNAAVVDSAIEALRTAEATEPVACAAVDTKLSQEAQAALDAIDGNIRDAAIASSNIFVGTTPPPSPVTDERAFKLGDRVTKKSGARWTGRVVGFYNTNLTPCGYAVESENEPGSVQIYPEAALEPAEEGRWPAGCRKPNSCSRHRACMYANCRHQSRDISGEIDAALATTDPQP